MEAETEAVKLEWLVAIRTLVAKIEETKETVSGFPNRRLSTFQAQFDRNKKSQKKRRASTWV